MTGRRVRIAWVQSLKYAILLDVRLVFDEVKATQAAALMIGLAGGDLSYMSLIKLLYRSDREALRRWGFPITTDHYVSMDYGPVTSTIYDRIKTGANAWAHPSFWGTCIVKSKYNVTVISDPGTSELSKAEENLLAEIFSTHGHKDQFELADETHADFPEWKNPGGSSSSIDLAEIIDALGLSEDDTRNIEAQVSSNRAAAELSL